MNEKLKRLLTPEGVRDLLPELAGKKRGLESRIQEIFGRWGYCEVSTPAFEYSANFIGDMKADLEDNVYRFLDERGRTLVLRPDFTLPLARVSATHLAGGAMPLRLCYGGNIYRYASQKQGKQRELTQAGVELIGSGCAGADAEVIALAAAVLQELGLAEFTLCLGHVGFLDALLESYSVSPAGREQIKEYFSKKDFVSLKDMVQNLPVSTEAKEAIMRVPMLRGGKETLAEAASLVVGGEAKEPLRVLAEVWDVLDDYGATQFATVDLGLVRNLDYYTGMVFEGYTGGLGYAICGGGRYDQLLGNFGPELPAVGFALNIDHLLTLLQKKKMLQQGQATVLAAFAANERAAAVATAQVLRAEGARVTLDVKPRSREEALREAGEHKAGRLFYHSADGPEEFCLQTEGGRAEC
jgi:ATP phosphoribosyltransferase regulatory subunit